MAIVIYVRGYSNRPEFVWRNAHPRGRRTATSLHLFDYEDDVHRGWASWNGKLPPDTPPSTEDPITGVLDLYDFVKSRSAGDVRELHFFTHGWAGGPLLHNDDEAPFFDATLLARDPNDADPRIKDFGIDTVLGGAEGRKFRSAFAKSALIKLWGCTHDEALRQMIKRDFWRATPTERQAITVRYKQLIRDGTYQYGLHVVTGLPVYAAPLGWGTNPYLPFGIEGARATSGVAKYRGVFPPAKGDQWWRVSPFFRPDRGRDYYMRTLGARLDILDYVRYSSTLVS